MARIRRATWSRPIVVAGAAGGLPQLVGAVDLAVRDPQHHQHLHHHRVTHGSRRRHQPPVAWRRSTCSERSAAPVQIGSTPSSSRLSSRTRRSLPWAVELRLGEIRRRPAQDLVRPAQLTASPARAPWHLERPPPTSRPASRRHRPQPARTQLRNDSVPIPELLRHPADRPVIRAQLLAQLTDQLAPPVPSPPRVYRRVVGFPGDLSSGMTPSSFPRSGASNEPRVVQSVSRFDCRTRRSLGRGERVPCRLCRRRKGRRRPGCRHRPR